MTETLRLINGIVPTYPGEVPEDVRLPYAFYSTTERPILTMNGIAGYEGDLSLSIVSPNKKTSRRIAERVIATINGVKVGKATAYCAEVSDEEDLEQGLYTTTVNFNTLIKK